MSELRRRFSDAELEEIHAFTRIENVPELRLDPHPIPLSEKKKAWGGRDWVAHEERMARQFGILKDGD